MAQGEDGQRLTALEKDLKRIERRMGKLGSKLDEQVRALRGLSKDMELRERREQIFLAALGLRQEAKVGDRGGLEDIDDSILKLEDYLLAMGERVTKILEMLQEHREYLERVNETVVKGGRRERMRLELEIMMNSVTILAMAGIEVDPSIPTELEELRGSIRDERKDLEGLRTRLKYLEERLQGEVKRYDLDQIFGKRKQIPGYG